MGSSLSSSNTCTGTRAQLTPLHSLVARPSSSSSSHPDGDGDGVVSLVVCGAGMAGLTFARSMFYLRDSMVAQQGMRLPDLRITVLERDVSDVEREAQGYSLSLRADAIGGGIQCLDRIGLLDTIRAGAAPGERFRFADAQFRVYAEMQANSTLPNDTNPDKPYPINIRVARRFLRNTLLQSLPDYTPHHDAQPSARASAILESSGSSSSSSSSRCNVVFNAHAVRADPFIDSSGAERVRVTLNDGSTLDADMVVAADGANSSIRRYLFPSETLEYANCIAFTACVPCPKGLPEIVADGPLMSISGSGECVFLAPVDAYKFVFSLSYMSREKLATEYRGDRITLSAEQLAQFERDASHYAKPFHPILQQFIKQVDPRTIRVINFQDKPPHTHTGHSPRIVFLGDASHAVSPFAGNGANMAIMDGYDLAAQLLSPAHGLDVAAALRQYDAVSQPRSIRTRNMSHFNIAFGHSTGWKSTMYKTMFRGLGFVLTKPRQAKFIGITLLATATALTGLKLFNHFNSKPSLT